MVARFTVGELEIAGADNGGVVGRDGVSQLEVGGIKEDMVLIGLRKGRRNEGMKCRVRSNLKWKSLNVDDLRC